MMCRLGLGLIVLGSILLAACDLVAEVAPTARLQSTPAAATPLSGTPTGNPITERTDWTLYTDPAHGFEFRYPEACQVSRVGSGELTLGSRIELATEDANGLPLPTYVDRFVDERTKAGGWMLETREAESIGSRQAIRIEYRFGGTGRFGTALFVERRGMVYTWNLTAGGFTCDEPDVYPDIVASFRFLE